MCGICGKVALASEGRVDPQLVTRMTTALEHRGPDDTGIYSSPQAALGHARLSIIDLNTGRQPITNEDRTVWVVFNGEIYNFNALRQKLQQRGHVFTTQTDTEVIVHGYEEFGESFVQQLQGMFAFALWDEKRRLLMLARDRVGIKPLYYTVAAGAVIFGSEIKALLVDSSVKREVHSEIIDRFLTFFYTPGRETLFQNIFKLEPGHYLLVKDGQVQSKRYWDLEFGNGNGPRDFKASKADLAELLSETVRNHMISDVPVGILLSGGVDSTGVLSFAVAGENERINSFTIGFDDKRFADERPYARIAAERFGNRHHEMTISAKDFAEFLPRYVWHMEEPVCEPPAVALYYISKLAREHVKVLLSGEGGDEAFAGYQNYRNILWVERFKSLGGPLARAASRLLEQLNRFQPSQRARKYSMLMAKPLADYYYSRTGGPFSAMHALKTSLYLEPFKRKLGSSNPALLMRPYFEKVTGQGVLNQMLYVDTKTWLPDDLLIKADKMTMANSLELRVPLLDHKVLEFAAHLPEAFKVRGFSTKYILKETLADAVPAQILNRKKTGFPVPYETWFSHELRGFVRDILTDSKALERGYFERKAMLQLLDTNDGSYAAEIFSLLTLELWHRAFLDSTPTIH